jgi:hypothetical protein
VGERGRWINKRGIQEGWIEVAKVA